MYFKYRYYKTVAAQEPGEDNILAASYRKKRKDVAKSAHLLPFFGTDYGLCRLVNICNFKAKSVCDILNKKIEILWSFTVHYSLVKPQITFDDKLEHVPFADLMQQNTENIMKGINLGKENGLSLLLDAEVYDYAFSPQKGIK